MSAQVIDIITRQPVTYDHQGDDIRHALFSIGAAAEEIAGRTRAPSIRAAANDIDQLVVGLIADLAEAGAL